MSKYGYKLLALLWLAVVLCLGLYSTQSLLVKGKIQFDLLALLPEGKTENMRLSNELLEEGNISNRLVVAFGHENSERAKEALNDFRRLLKPDGLPLLEQSVQQVEASYKALFADLYPYRAGLLSKSDREALLKGDDGSVIKRAVASLSSPFSILSADQMSTDPFGFYPRYVTSFLSSSPFQTDAEGNIAIRAEGKTWYLFQGEVTEKIFSIKLQEKIAESLIPLLTRIEKEGGVEILRVGAAFYSSAGAEQAKNEISVIGLISTLGIILMLLLVFRVPHPIFLTLVVLSSGLIGGLAACLFFFGSVHVLALVFGSSLVGVAVDYVLHFYCASYKSANRYQVLTFLMPAMPLGVITSSIGYGALIMAPFPGVQQMAFMACMGLLCTFISVAAWGPYFVVNKKAPSLAFKIQSWIERLAKLGSGKYLKSFMITAALAIFCTGIYTMSFDDDVRNFQALDPQLKRQEEKIKAMMNFNQPTSFLAITGSSLETVLQTEEAVVDELERRGMVCRALSDLIPSQKRQGENSANKLEFCRAHFSDIARALELEPEFNPTAGGFDAQPITRDVDYLKNLPTGWKELIHVSKEGQVTGRIMIPYPLEATIFENYPGTTYVDTVREYSQLFASYRKMMLWLVASLSVTFALMIGLYRGVRSAVAIAAPVMLSILTTVGLLGGMGINFSMFHGMGLILVLCIGIDYALFLYWRKSHEQELLLLGNALAALTTILSFGLLALSKTAAVHSFGLTVFIGIVLNFFITTLLLGGKSCKNS